MSGNPQGIKDVEPKSAHPRQKIAPTEFDLERDIRGRWSPRAFSDRSVRDEELLVLLEAARWAPSSYNEQPWRFIVAKREDEDAFERALRTLAEANQEWARHAPVLMLTVAQTDFTQQGRPNRHAFHDVGLAMGNLIHQAMALDLYVHQMAGISPDLARELFAVPKEFEVVAGVAIGYLGDPEQLEDDARREAEESERSRKPLRDLVFSGRWGSVAPLVERARLS